MAVRHIAQQQVVVRLYVLNVKHNAKQIHVHQDVILIRAVHMVVHQQTLVVVVKAVSLVQIHVVQVVPHQAVQVRRLQRL